MAILNLIKHGQQSLPIKINFFGNLINFHVAIILM